MTHFFCKFKADKVFYKIDFIYLCIEKNEHI